MAETLTIAVAQSPAELVGPPARYDWLKQKLSNWISDKPDVLILPELFLSGYNIGDKITTYAEPENGPWGQKIAALAAKHNIAILYGFAEFADEKIYNTAQFIDANGIQITKHRKLQIPPGFEDAYFSSGDTYTLFEYHTFTIAVLICYDAEFPEAFRAVATQGAELVIVPTALSAEWGVVANQLIPTRAFENGVYAAYANQAGVENEMQYYGGSCIIAPNGAELARADDKPQILTATLAREAVTSAQARLPYHRDLKNLPATD